MYSGTNLVFLMGGTCVGKTTFLDHVRNTTGNDFGFVEVGKYMRTKYPTDNFAGQAAPEHTKVEAWKVCEEGIHAASSSGQPFVLIDGQPRSVDQVHSCVTRLSEFPHKLFVLLDCPLEERKRRRDLRNVNASPRDIELSNQRLQNDMISYYTVMVELMKHGYPVNVVDSTALDMPLLLRRIYRSRFTRDGVLL